MTYHITALENTRARLIVNETRVSGTDKVLVDLIVAHLESRGYIVTVREER